MEAAPGAGLAPLTPDPIDPSTTQQEPPKGAAPAESVEAGAVRESSAAAAASSATSEPAASPFELDALLSELAETFEAPAPKAAESRASSPLPEAEPPELTLSAAPANAPAQAPAAEPEEEGPTAAPIVAHLISTQPPSPTGGASAGGSASSSPHAAPSAPSVARGTSPRNGQTAAGAQGASTASTTTSQRVPPVAVSTWTPPSAVTGTAPPSGNAAGPASAPSPAPTRAAHPAPSKAAATAAPGAGRAARASRASAKPAKAAASEAPAVASGTAASAATPAMDRDFIARNQIVERYFSGKLPLKGAGEFERFCKDHPELLDEIGLPERVNAGLRLLEAAGKPEPWREPSRRFWHNPVIPMCLAAAVAILLFATVGLEHSLAQKSRAIQSLNDAVASQPLEPATTTRTIRLLPSREGASASPAVVIGAAGQTQLADLHIDLTHSPYKVYRIIIDRADQGRVAILNNMAKDSNGHVRIALNSSALGPGNYQFTIEGLNWRGEPQPDSWVTIGVQH